MANGSLNLMSAVSLENGEKLLSVTDQALTDVVAVGFRLPVRPVQPYQGSLPSNLVDLDDRSLGELLTQASTWCNFAGDQLVMARAALNEAEAKMEFVKSKLRLIIKSAEDKKPSNPEMDDMVRADARFLDAQRTYLYRQAVYDYTKQLVEGAQRDWDTISRRITQRGQDVDRMTRGHSVSNVPLTGSAFRRP